MAIGINNTTPAQRGNSLGRVVEWRWGLLTLWLLGTTLFLARASAGYFLRPLSSLGLSAVSLVAVVVALELRAVLRGNYRATLTAPPMPVAWLAQLLPTIGMLLLAIGFSVAGAHPTGLVLLWIMTAGEVLLGAGGPWTLPLIQQLWRRDRTDRGTTVLDHPRDTLKTENFAAPAGLVKATEALAEPVAPSEKRHLLAELEAAEREADEPEADLENELPWLWHDAMALQELRYMTLPDQGLCIAGSQRATFPAAQQFVTIHTVFHPSFDSVPAVTIELQEPDSITIKAAQILPHGIRWELRSSSAQAHPQQVQWAFTATTRNSRG